MIRPIDIKLNAAHPELPLVEATTFTGAPSSVFIRGVPKSCGNWSITAINVAVTYPDNSTTTRAAVESAEGVWVATIPGTATSGRTAAGFKIMADGTDENGAAVTGYVLGFADFSVLSFTPVPAPGGTFYLLRYFDQAPATPKEGDVAKIDGVLKFYNGSAWEPFAAPVTFDDAVTRTSANGVKSSGIWSAIWGALSALPAGFTSLYDWCVSQLAGKASEAEAEALRTGKLDKSDVVAPSTSSADSGKAADAKSTGDAIAALAPDWISGSSYARYDVVKYNGVYYYALSAINDSSAVPSLDPTWGSLANLAAVVKKFLPLTGGTMTGDLNIKKTSGASFVRVESGPRYVGIRCDSTSKVIETEDYNFELPDDDGTLALTSAIPYSLGTPTVIDTASSETVEGETVTYGAALLTNRTANILQVTAATALDELRITFPAATSGKVRDFGLRVEIGTGSAALTAPALVPIAPTGETIKIENADGTIPELADGTAAAKGVTLLYFSETAPGVFVVKGEQVEEVA